MSEVPLSFESLELPPTGRALQRLEFAGSDAAITAIGADVVLESFDRYYYAFRQIPNLAQQNFEQRNPAQTLHLSQRRLRIYVESIHELLAQIKQVCPRLSDSEELWRRVERHYVQQVRGRYEEDLAIAYIHSARRLNYGDEWSPVDYSVDVVTQAQPTRESGIAIAFEGAAQLSPDRVLEILEIPGFSVPYRDASGDAQLVAERINRTLALGAGDGKAFQAIEMIRGGFFRNRGAYLVGRFVWSEDHFQPFVLALECAEDGIFVDAVLTAEAHTHNIFSSTLANFHVTNDQYHELAAFLFSIMPQRPLGLHYSTIGYNHLGKVAVLEELRRELADNDEVFDQAVGFRGTVAIGFSAASSAYVLKIIRDEPTENYKWGTFEGIESVLDKYRKLHEINRTGSMLDNIIYYRIRLRKSWFDDELLEEILRCAGKSVSLQGEHLVFKHLIVQPKMVPLPVFLETASPRRRELAVINLGHCIKNNAVANIFNKDLDGRNYGVSRYLKVYLFDYDAIEDFTEVKVRTNQDRFDGEEDIPEWFFEDGVIFLPEEIEVGLRLHDRDLRRLFRESHPELYKIDYWEEMQTRLRRGDIPRSSIYPEWTRLIKE